ncbi:MAG TPA: FG-GAP-like repeat-containing protein, partial [Candidatus Acidoferrum sp.]|nr:FG-GAP-like repeat-containing protein [Candidatus Acidoferrum sp.]
MKTYSLRRAAIMIAIAALLTFRPIGAIATTVSVTVGNGGFFFSPSSVTIHPGDTVQWSWSASGHSSTSGSPGMPNGLWDSGILNMGATFSHTFNSAGSFHYYCTPHGQCCGMVGMVTVSNATPTPMPSPTPGAGKAAVADVNRDGHQDVVLRNAGTRGTAIWYLNNNVFISSAFGPTLQAGWSLRGLGDFDHDGHPDYALFNSSTRQTAIWYLSGPIFVRGAFGPTPPSGWELVTPADLNGDGKPDYVLYNASTRRTVILYLNNNVLINGVFGPTLPA